jgi:hypothetical protein
MQQQQQRQDVQGLPLGLDSQAQAAVVAEQQHHQQRITEIASREAGMWSYTLEDENARHCMLLQQIFQQARVRTMGILS